MSFCVTYVLSAAIACLGIACARAFGWTGAFVLAAIVGATAVAKRRAALQSAGSMPLKSG